MKTTLATLLLFTAFTASAADQIIGWALMIDADDYSDGDGVVAVASGPAFVKADGTVGMFRVEEWATILNSQLGALKESMTDEDDIVCLIPREDVGRVYIYYSMGVTLEDVVYLANAPGECSFEGETL